jgi:hypothetical protein
MPFPSTSAADVDNHRRAMVPRWCLPSLSSLVDPPESSGCLAAASGQYLPVTSVGENVTFSVPRFSQCRRWYASRLSEYHTIL